MMPQDLMQIGVGGIFAVFILREVFGFVKSVLKGKDKQGSQVHETFESICFKVDELYETHKNNPFDANAMIEVKDKVHDIYEMHNVKDESGVYVWYTKSSLEKAIEKLCDVIEAQFKVLNKMSGDLIQIQFENKNHDDKLDRLLQDAKNKG